MVKMYGIPNCDSVKKAVKWLEDKKIPFEFHDYKKQVITSTTLKEWSKVVGWQVLLNKKSSTWRQLQADGQQEVNSQVAAISLMQAHTSIIKRPVIAQNGTILVGFNEEQYKQAFL